MTNIDGYARVITNETGRIIDVIDYHFDHPNLCNHLGGDEIMDTICDIESKDAEVLIPLTYHYDRGGYRGGDYDDPSEELYVVNEYVLRWDYKKSLIAEIHKAIIEDEETLKRFTNEYGNNRNELISSYADMIGDHSEGLIEYYELIYKETYCR